MFFCKTNPFWYLSWDDSYSGFLFSQSAALTVQKGMNRSVSFTRSSSDRVINGHLQPRAAPPKTVWVWTKSKDVMTASIEGGWSTFIFTPDTKDLAHEWACTVPNLFSFATEFVLALNYTATILSNVHISFPLVELRVAALSSKFAKFSFSFSDHGV